MTSPPSNWRDGVTNLAVRVFVITLLLYIAARLILAVLPVLIVAGVIGFIGFVGWSIYQFRRSRW
jgi:hypothetical protein